MLSTDPSMVFTKPNVLSAQADVLSTKPSVLSTKSHVLATKPSVLSATSYVLATKPNELSTDPTFSLQESPVYTLADEELSQLNGKFDLISNYLLDSDFPISYIPEVVKKVIPDTKRINYAYGKTKMAIWFVSHCNASSGRDEYVRELQKYIPVDIYGELKPTIIVEPVHKRSH